MAAVFGCGVILWIEKRGVGRGDRKALVDYSKKKSSTKKECNLL
jgi:hypothetical protein